MEGSGIRSAVWTWERVSDVFNEWSQGIRNLNFGEEEMRGRVQASGGTICQVVATPDIAGADFQITLLQKSVDSSEDLIGIVVSTTASLPAFHHSRVVSVDAEHLFQRLEASEYGDEKLEAHHFCPANIFPIRVPSCA